MISKNQLSGIILAGGKSTRMGKDKALLIWEGTTMANHLAKLMSAFCNEVIISGDPILLDSIPGKKIPDGSPDLGPMGGILSCLHQIETPFAVIVPCDMPFLDSAILSFLISSWKETDTVLCFANRDKMQPLVGIYRKSESTNIEQFLLAGEKRAWKMVELLCGRTIGFPEIEFGNTGEPELNVNSPAQYFYAINKKHRMVRLLFFGSLADKAGGRESSVPAPPDLKSLINELKLKFPGLDLSAAIIAVNQNIVKTDIVLSAGDEVAFMPPFAGG